MPAELLYSGKTRDVYQDGDDLIMVASDRVSVHDVVLPTPIPGKGEVLTRTTLWWFDQLTGIIPNHVVSSTYVPDKWWGRAIRVQPLTMIPVEFIARAYLTGMAWAAYQRDGGRVCGIQLPPGLNRDDPLPTPIFTPASKAPAGQHDQLLTMDEAAQVGGSHVAALSTITMMLFSRARTICAGKGLVLADMKLEFGYDELAGELKLADEVLTPDSARYRDAVTGEKYCKQLVRDWADATGWDRTPPGPAMTADEAEFFAGRYAQVAKRLTG